MNVVSLGAIVWDASPVMLEFGGRSLLWYSFFCGLSVLLGWQMLLYFLRREGMNTNHADRIAQYVFFGGFIGARLGMVLFYEPGYYFANPMEILKVWKGGLASHGGAIGIMLALWLYSKRYTDINLWWLLDRGAIAALPIAGLIRLGNLFNSEIYGKVTDVPWAFIFPLSDPSLQARHPSQLYDVILVFGMFVLLFLIYRKKESYPDGYFVGLFFTFCFGIRALLEFFKEDAVTTQLLSLPLVAIGLFLLFRIWKKKDFTTA
ncbi:prolipoprotein diacylglyceryl transferase [Chitinophagales bacterium]|nr:prolipoprotein diacylglyceryl transferase [Chitinophagales bacterium]